MGLCTVWRRRAATAAHSGIFELSRVATSQSTSQKMVPLSRLAPASTMPQQTSSKGPSRGPATAILRAGRCMPSEQHLIGGKATFHSQSGHDAIDCVVVIDGATTNTANETLLHHIKTVISSQPGSPLPCLEARSGTDASAEILRQTAGMSPPDAGPCRRRCGTG
jgi:hypothetical protein